MEESELDWDRVHLIRILPWRHLYDLVRRCDYEKASEEAIELLTGSSSPELHYHVGLAYLRMGNWESAVRTLTRSVDMSAHAGALLLLGTAYWGTGNGGEAIGNIARSVEISPNAPSLVLLGKLQQQQRLFDDAFESFTKAIDLDPEHLQAYDLLCMMLIEKCRYLEALKWYDEARKYLREGAINKAVSKAKYIEKENPARGEGALAELHLQTRSSLFALAVLFNNMGTCYAATGDYADARRLYNRALKFASEESGFSEPLKNLKELEAILTPQTSTSLADKIGRRLRIINDHMPKLAVRFFYFDGIHKVNGINVELNPLLKGGGTESRLLRVK